MKMMMIATDITAIGFILGSAANVLPAIAGLLAAIWYGFVIYDRIRYGPEISNRTFWKQKTETKSGTVVTSTLDITKKEPQ